MANEQEMNTALENYASQTNRIDLSRNIVYPV